MTAKINKKIASYKVKTEEQVSPLPLDIDVMHEGMKRPEILHEGMKRPEVLHGSTYKVKTPQSDSALYITINDVILNEDTEHEKRVPYEIFCNSKEMSHFQWVLALTRVLSANFRKGGEIAFLVEELKGVFDPAGGYWKKGGVFMPSVVAEIGHVLESHLKRIGVIQVENMPEYQKEFLASKKAEFEAKNS